MSCFGEAHCLKYYDVLSDYEGSEDITDLDMKMLNKDYFINNTFPVRKATNMCYVAYLLDRGKWTSKFVTNTSFRSKVEYVVGSPSVELIFDACNKKYNSSYRAKAVSEKGYKISKGDDAGRGR